MREVLFRGKRLDNGNWVEGFYVCMNNERHYIFTGKLNTSGLYPTFVYYEVDPKTVAQFTGLYTAADKKIWSGDIARFGDELYVVQRECDTPGGYWAETGYILKHIGWSDYLSFTDTIDDYYNEICVAIIGNIYDNPELLGG